MKFGPKMTLVPIPKNAVEPIRHANARRKAGISLGGQIFPDLATLAVTRSCSQCNTGGQSAHASSARERG